MLAFPTTAGIFEHSSGVNTARRQNKCRFPLTRTAVVFIVSVPMKAELTTQISTRALAGVVMFPRDRRMSWQMTKNYSVIGGQEELLN